jgi:hypothetical protein
MISLSRCASRSTGLPALLPLLSLVVLSSLLLTGTLCSRRLLPALLTGALGTLVVPALLLSALLISIFLHREISFDSGRIDRRCVGEGARAVPRKRES